MPGMLQKPEAFACHAIICFGYRSACDAPLILFRIVLSLSPSLLGQPFPIAHGSPPRFRLNLYDQPQIPASGPEQRHTAVPGAARRSRGKSPHVCPRDVLGPRP